MKTNETLHQNSIQTENSVIYGNKLKEITDQIEFIRHSGGKQDIQKLRGDRNLILVNYLNALNLPEVGQKVDIIGLGENNEDIKNQAKTIGIKHIIASPIIHMPVPWISIIFSKIKKSGEVSKIRDKGFIKYRITKFYEPPSISNCMQWVN